MKILILLLTHSDQDINKLKVKFTTCIIWNFESHKQERIRDGRKEWIFVQKSIVVDLSSAYSQTFILFSDICEENTSPSPPSLSQCHVTNCDSWTMAKEFKCWHGSLQYYPLISCDSETWYLMMRRWGFCQPRVPEWLREADLSTEKCGV